MKTRHTLLFAFILFFSYAGYAQHKHIPISEDSAVWVTFEQAWTTKVPTRYYIGRMEGVDTIFNGKRYFCYFGELPNNYLPPRPPKTTPAYIGDFLRQDSITKKVWYLRSQSVPDKEELLYDFSLKKGDTITDSLYYYFSPKRLYPHKAWIDDVDSVYWADGTWRYRWWIKSNYGYRSTSKAIVIEGMGYTNNLIDDPLLEYHPMGSSINEVVCYREKKLWVYTQPNPWHSDCDTMVTRNVKPVSVNETFVNELNEPLLYPNPARLDGYITLSTYAGKTGEPVSIIAFNTQGQKVCTKFLKPCDRLSLNALQTGVYNFIVFNAAHQVICSQKISIQ